MFTATLTTLWKFFHYSPKCAQSLKEVQKVLNLPELKDVKPSDTRWLSHERCVKAVKMSYSAIIVLALDGIYNENHRPEALGLSKILSKPSTLYAIFLLDEILPQTAKMVQQYSLADLNSLNTMCIYGVTFGYRSLHLLLKLTVNFSKQTTTTAVWYRSPDKLSKALHVDLSAISVLVDNTLNMIDVAMEPAANWILHLRLCKEYFATSSQMVHEVS